METATAMKNDLKRKADQINPQHREGPIAKELEKQTSKIPSDAFLWTSFGVMAASLVLKVLKKDHTALFVGQWAAPILLMGVYNKLVKTVGHSDTEPVNE